MRIKTGEHSIEIQSGHAGPHILIVAGVHGDEYEPMIAVMELRKLLEGSLSRGRVTLITIANVSAYQAGKRTGIDSLDLARTCPGNQDGSETEAAAFVLSGSIRECDYLIDMHTGGALFELFPLCGYMLHRNEEILETQRLMAAAFNLPLIWGTDAQPDGRTLSVARDEGIPAIYVEYGGGNNVDRSIIDACVKGCLGVLAHLNVLKEGVFKRGDREVLYRVEDDQPDSGFLQGKMRCAFDGIFIPGVKVGAMVEEGQEWGVVFDPVEQAVHPVFADASGLVLFIRKEPRVNKGASLGGILKIK
ncbi:succinylglutamate desuccinylase/aspartoacylase family protein [Niabella beijingensis]|uniref:succinylglutamate desuccinylase/aspartoacylase family protein n=1 Tax=Niabella beijingensis TaxID=2872700 RepID=UPI001CBE6AB2|nr:M14 family metallopeptidase [Niabella beijingensis]